MKNLLVLELNSKAVDITPRASLGELLEKKKQEEKNMALSSKENDGRSL